MRRFLTAWLSAIALAALAGCGQMGPLYMPPPEDPATTAPEEPAAPSQPKAAAS